MDKQKTGPLIAAAIIMIAVFSIMLAVPKIMALVGKNSVM